MFHYSELIPRVQPQLQKAGASSGLSMIDILEQGTRSNMSIC